MTKIRSLGAPFPAHQFDSKAGAFTKAPHLLLIFSSYPANPGNEGPEGRISRGVAREQRSELWAPGTTKHGLTPHGHSPWEGSRRQRPARRVHLSGMAMARFTPLSAGAEGAGLSIPHRTHQSHSPAASNRLHILPQQYGFLALAMSLRVAALNIGFIIYFTLFLVPIFVHCLGSPW